MLTRVFCFMFCFFPFDGNFVTGFDLFSGNENGEGVFDDKAVANWLGR